MLDLLSAVGILYAYSTLKTTDLTNYFCKAKTGYNAMIQQQGQTSARGTLRDKIKDQTIKNIYR